MADRCAALKAEEMEAPVERLQRRMPVADRALRLHDCCCRFQVATQRGVGMLDRGRRLQPSHDGLDIGAGGVAELLGDEAAGGVPRRGPDTRARTRRATPLTP